MSDWIEKLREKPSPDVRYRGTSLHALWPLLCDVVEAAQMVHHEYHAAPPRDVDEDFLHSALTDLKTEVTK